MQLPYLLNIVVLCLSVASVVLGQEQATATLTGRVIGFDSDLPLAGAEVRLVRWSGREADFEREVQKADAQGRFSYASLVPGATYSVSVTAAGYRPFGALETRFQAEPGGKHVLPDVQLLPDRPLAADPLWKVKAPAIEGLSGEDAFALLVSRYNEAHDEFVRRRNASRERLDLTQRVMPYEPAPVYVPILMELAKSHPNSDVAMKSLIWVCNAPSSGASDKRIRPARQQAAQQLLAEYLDRKELVSCVPQLIYSERGRELAIATSLMEQNAHREVQGEACLTLALFLKQSPPRRGLEESQQEQCVQMFERVALQYGDLPHWRLGTMEKVAERELFELRRLCVGAVAPNIVGRDLEGRPMSLDEFRGRVVVIGFWSGGDSDLHEAQNAAKSRGEDSLVLLGVCAHHSFEDALKTVSAQRMTWRNWFDRAESAPSIADQWNVSSWPTNYVLDRKGVIRYKGEKARGTSLYRAVLQVLAEGE